MVNVAWPLKLKPSEFGFSYIDTDTSGGASLGGSEQFVISPGQRWSASMTLPIFDDAGVLAVRMLRTQLQGKVNPAILPNFDGYRLSWPAEAVTGRTITPTVARKLDGTYGLVGTGYGYNPAVIPAAAEIVATLGAAVAVGDTTCSIVVTQGGVPKAGQQFSLGNRLYEMSSVVVTTGTTYTVDFRPRVRTAQALGAAVNFTRATCLMRCLNLDDQTRKFQWFRNATLNLEFLEYF